MSGNENNWKKTAVPIYRKVAADLRAQILSGKRKNGEKLPSEAEFSASLGINHQTLRKSLKILAEQHLISQCQGKGTFVTLQQEEHLKIGVLLGNNLENLSGNIYALRAIAGLSKAMSKNHYGELLLLDYKDFSDIMPAYHRGNCDGLIILSTLPDTVQYLCRPEFDHVPMVFLNADKQFLEDHDKYHVSEESGAVRTAMTELYAMGHRKIGFVWSPYPNVIPLYEEYRTFCRENGLKEYARAEQGIWFDTVRRLTFELCRSEDRPTAFVEPGFNFSYAAWQGIMDAGLKIPEDISFIGFDANTNSNPYMSSMMHPTDKTTEKAVSLLVEMRHKGKHLKQHFYEFPAEFLDHGSCRKL